MRTSKCRSTPFGSIGRITLLATLTFVLGVLDAAKNVAGANDQACAQVNSAGRYDTERRTCLIRRMSAAACNSVPGMITWHKDRGHGADVCEYAVPRPRQPSVEDSSPNRGNSTPPRTPSYSLDNPFANPNAGQLGSRNPNQSATNSGNPFITPDPGRTPGSTPQSAPSADNPFANPDAGKLRPTFPNPTTSADNPFAPDAKPPAAPTRPSAVQAANALNCGIIIGSPVQTRCIGSGENCKCLNLLNSCPYPVTIRYQRTNNSYQSSFRLEGKKQSTGDACTTQDSEQGISYLGFSRPPG